MNRISKARQARIDAGEEKLNYGSTIGQRTGERKKKPTLDELKKKGAVKKASSLSTRRNKKMVGETQVDVFEEIWNARPHVCQVCGHPIRTPKSSNFSHILGKGAYELMKLHRKNVEIWCCGLDRRDGKNGCHDLWTYKAYDKSDPKWQRVMKLEEELKEEARTLGHR